MKTLTLLCLPQAADLRESVRRGSNLYMNRRLYVRDWYLRHQVAPADWSGYYLWRTVELVAGKPTWQRNHLQITVSYSEKLGVMRGSLSRYTLNYQVCDLSKSMLPLASIAAPGGWSTYGT